MNNGLEKLKQLYIENDKEIGEKITSYICNRLPIEIVFWKKELDKNKINVQKTNFIHDFLNNEKRQFFYIKEADIFIKYDNLNYSIINEDDLLYLILSEISKNTILLQKKQNIKDLLIKEIKTNIFGYGIPESTTIQNIINYFYPVLFKTKSEAKYFLCILGDNIMKKKNNITYVTRHCYKTFLNHINDSFKDYYNYDILNNFNDTINNKINLNMRILDFKPSIQNKGFWQHFLDHNVLNIISVAIHYSQRYDNSEEYLQNKIEDKEKILYFKNNKKTDIIDKFISKYIVEKTNEKITNIELYYLWQLFLIDENIPCLFESDIDPYDHSHFSAAIANSKLHLKRNLTDHSYYNIFSHKLNIVRKFHEFWKNNVKEDINEVVEISEIFYFFKQQTNIKTSSEREILFLIEYFYSHVKITNNKYIHNISCKLWNKKQTIFNVIKKIDEKHNIEQLTNINLYKKYCQYLKQNKDELVVNKNYFMDVIKNIKSKIINEK